MATRTRRGSVGRSHGAPCSCGRSSRVIIIYSNKLYCINNETWFHIYISMIKINSISEHCMYTNCRLEISPRE